MNIFSLKGKRALVTGGGTGIGLGISKAFIEAGAEVVITGRREEVLQDAFKELGENVRYRVFDITHKKEIPAFIQDLETQFGGIDILVNNAGIHLKKFSNETTDEEFESIIQTNLFFTYRECAKYMAQRKSGVILFIGSMAGIFGIDRVSAYGTSKQR
jgi:gluconate 5-dehydrogenase